MVADTGSDSSDATSVDTVEEGMEVDGISGISNFRTRLVLLLGFGAEDTFS